jgi:ABC-type transport system involved in cytochrome c biogenesis permease subunit
MKKIFFVLLFLGIMMPAYAVKSETSDIDWTYFSMIPVLHEGRVKPMDTLSRLEMDQADNHETSKMLPDAWMAETIFRPMWSAQRRQFAVYNDEIRRILFLQERRPPLYSFDELGPALDSQAKRLSVLMTARQPLTRSQHDLVSLYKAVTIQGQLMESMTAILPLSIRVPKILVPKEDEGRLPAYADVQKYRERAGEILATVIRKKGKNIKNYASDEQEIASFLYQVHFIEETGTSQGELLRVIPLNGPKDGQEWISPWRVLITGEGSSSGTMLLGLWQKTARAYLEGNNAEFTNLSRQLLEQTLSAAQFGKVDVVRLKIEILYNVLKPFGLALLLYAGAVFLCGVAYLNSYRNRENFLKRSAYYTLGTGSFLHLAAIAVRIFILSRPPVGTLYESLLFVSMLCPAIMLISFHYKRNKLFLLCGSILGAGILGFASILNNSGDTLEMLAAVLNTNFWLGTHVLCITAGYSVSLLAGTMAHIRLAENVFLKKKKGQFSISDNILYGMTVLALLLMTLGTMLGGIWADQSWGRFWGWDPKENGALLIVIWLLWLLHGKAANVVSPLLYAVILAFINVIVALSWFGVNLLGVGLHSYGFTSGIALGLFLFCAAETGTIATFWFLANRRETAV